MTKHRLFFLMGLELASLAACSSGDVDPAPTGTSGTAGAGQAGAAGKAGTAGSASSGGSAGASGAAPTSGGAGVAGQAGTSSGGGQPGIALKDCTGLPDGTICDKASGFASSASAFCAHEECHLLSDFVLQCWNLVPTCIEGESFGVFDYALQLAIEASCPAPDDMCKTPEVRASGLGFALIDCAKSGNLCDTNELRSAAMTSPGTHQGKVRCRDFSLNESYCMTP
jgi:hypothetical protein